MKKIITILTCILFVFIITKSTSAKVISICPKGIDKEFFSLEDIDYVDTFGTGTDVYETRTDDYLYGKHSLWVSLSRTKNYETNGYYYILLIDGMTWAEGKHNKRTWFSTKNINFNITLENSEAIFPCYNIDGRPFVDSNYVIYGDNSSNDIILNQNFGITSHVKMIRNYSDTVYNRVNHSNNCIKINAYQNRMLEVNYDYEGYYDNRTLPCAGYYHQCFAIVIPSYSENLSVKVEMNASFFKDKKLGNNYTLTSCNTILNRSI